MRDFVLASCAVIMSLGTGAELARADCSTEVALGVQAMGKQKFLRKETQAFGESGPFKLLVEYQIPDRMRQVVTPLTEGKPVEAIVVGEKAWTNNGEGWQEAPPQETDALLMYMVKSSSQIYQEVGKFDCKGAETLDGIQVRAYRGLNEEPQAPPGVKKENLQAGTKNEAVRMIYLNAENGLPMRSIFAKEGMLDKPIFREDYSYPADIKIEPPEVKK